METEKAIEKLKKPKKIDLISIIRQFKREGIENFVITRSDIVETVLKELEKKDKIIDLTIDYLANNGVEKDICKDKISKNCNENCYECIKQYFEKKANEEAE